MHTRAQMEMQSNRSLLNPGQSSRPPFVVAAKTCLSVVMRGADSVCVCVYVCLRARACMCVHQRMNDIGKWMGHGKVLCARPEDNNGVPTLTRSLTHALI